MKRLFSAVALCSFSLLSFESIAGNYYTLYGYKIGQELQFAKQQFGEPNKVFSFEDGWKAYAYRRDGHSVIFQTDNTRPDLIISVQIEGERNPPNMGLDGIDLGSEAKKALEKLGTPSQRKQAEDLKTKKAIPNTYINYYGNNYSFEEREGKVTSIKIIYGGPAQASDNPDFDAFLQNVKSKNYYRIAESISSNLNFSRIEGPIIEQITGNTALNALLFGKDGIISLSSKDISEVNLRMADNTVGFVYKFKGKAIHELYFVRSFEGWVLFSAN